MGHYYDDFYRSGGFGYDKDIDRWRPWVAEHYVREFGLGPGTQLLDVGCGDGFWSMLLAENGIAVAGFDPSEGGIEIARERVPDGDFVVAGVDGPLPWPTASFDVAFMRNLGTFCYANILERAATELPNVTAVLRPGGLLLMSLHTRQTGEIEESKIINHKASVLTAAIETVANVMRMALVGNSLHIAARVTNS
jgi:SAM-dependent methyltransferase